MPANEAAVFAAIASFAAERGEPWVTRLRPTELNSRLTALGFSKVTHLSPQAANERYFGGRSDDGCLVRLSLLKIPSEAEFKQGREIDFEFA
jgi:hypothetical protein